MTDSDSASEGPAVVSAERPVFRQLDWILLATLCPLAVICFSLHVMSVVNDLPLLQAFYVAPASTRTDAPVVAGFLTEIENRGELQVGDRILSIGGVDALGAGELRVSALCLRYLQNGTVPMVIERGGVLHPIELSLLGLEVSWIRIPLLLGFAIVGVIVLVRSPGSIETRLMFVAFMNLVIFQSVFVHSWEPLFYAGIFIFQVWGVIAVSSLGVWVRRFPPDLPKKHHIHWGWGLSVGALWGLPRITHYAGGPLPLDSLSTQFFLVDTVLALALLCVLSLNYRNSSAVGRRQVRIVLLGVYLGMLPFAFMGMLVAVAPDYPSLRMLHAWAMGFVAIGPIGFLIAIARYNLFDIDRLISGTASYSLVLILGALAVEVLVEPFAGVLGESMGFEASSSQIVFVVALSAIMLPIQRAWRPYIDRVFFSSGRSNTEDIEQLLDALPIAASRGADALVSFVGEGLGAVFGPTFCVVYELRGHEFHPSFVSGEATDRPLSKANSQEIMRILGKRIGPMRLDSRGRKSRGPVLSQEVTAALQGLDASLLTPLRPQGSLNAFLCVGPKRTGDVYTSTDLTLMASVAHHVTEELSTIEDQ